jgi:hypothetical protein
VDNTRRVLMGKIKKKRLFHKTVHPDGKSVIHFFNMMMQVTAEWSELLIHIWEPQVLFLT